MARATSPTGGLMGRLPAGLRGRLLRGRVATQETLRDIGGSVVRNGWPTSVRGRSLAIMNSVFLHLHPIRTRPDAIKMTYTFGLGGISFYLFLMLTVTGVLLMFYYIPSVDQAYNTMKLIQEAQPFGYLLRNIDGLPLHAILITEFLHMS